MMKLQGTSSVPGSIVATIITKKMSKNAKKIKYISTRRDANNNNSTVSLSCDSSQASSSHSTAATTTTSIEATATASISSSIVSKSSIILSFPTVMDCDESTKSKKLSSSSLHLCRRQRTGVRFSTVVTVRIIRSCQDYKTPHEFDARWYTPREYQEMSQRCSEDDDFRRQLRRKHRVRKLASDTLFDAQFQYQDDTPERQEIILANLYQRYSSRCSVRAQSIGMNNQRVANWCYNNNLR